MKKNNLRYFRITFYLIFLLSISACDQLHTKEYYVQNESKAKVLLTFKVGEILDSLPIDPMEKELIYTQEYYFGSVGVEDDRYNDLVSTLVVQVDSTQKILEEDLWEYEELEKYHATYLMKIDSI